VNYATLAQIVIAVGLVGYGVVVGVQQLRGRLGRRTRVAVCEQLTHELLKPEAKA